MKYSTETGINFIVCFIIYKGAPQSEALPTNLVFSPKNLDDGIKNCACSSNLKKPPGFMT